MDEPVMPVAGQDAPPLEADVTGGGRFSLADRAGKWTVVYFFPRSMTPG